MLIVLQQAALEEELRTAERTFTFFISKLTVAVAERRAFGATPAVENIYNLLVYFEIRD